MSSLTTVPNPWPGERMRTLRALESALAAGVRRGHPHMRQPLQVVVAFIAELQGPSPAGPKV